MNQNSRDGVNAGESQRGPDEDAFHRASSLPERAVAPGSRETAGEGKITMERRAGWLVAALLAVGGTVAAMSGVTQGATGPGPTLTVMGFGVVNTTVPAQATEPQLQMNFQETTATASGAMKALYRDLSQTRKQFATLGVNPSAIMTQGPPNLNYQNGGEWQASDTLEVTFPTLAQLTHVVTASKVADNPAIQNFWINASYQSPTATPAALASGYATAEQNAAQTAQIMANAEHLQLGAQVSITQGAITNTQCGGMGACGGGVPMGVTVPSIGPNQELVAVTVTYETNPG
jgi:uncharacterized protein YggE